MPSREKQTEEAKGERERESESLGHYEVERGTWSPGEC